MEDSNPFLDPSDEELDRWLDAANEDLIEGLENHIDVESALDAIKRGPIGDQVERAIEQILGRERPRHDPGE